MWHTPPQALSPSGSPHALTLPLVLCCVIYQLCNAIALPLSVGPSELEWWLRCASLAQWTRPPPSWHLCPPSKHASPSLPLSTPSFTPPHCSASSVLSRANLVSALLFKLLLALQVCASCVCASCLAVPHSEGCTHSILREHLDSVCVSFKLTKWRTLHTDWQWLCHRNNCWGVSRKIWPRFMQFYDVNMLNE